MPKRDNPLTAHVSTRNPTTNCNNTPLEMELPKLVAPDLCFNRSWLKNLKYTQSLCGTPIEYQIIRPTLLDMISYHLLNQFMHAINSCSQFKPAILNFNEGKIQFLNFCIQRNVFFIFLS